MGCAKSSLQPSVEERITHPANTLLPELLKHVQAMTDDEKTAISRCDYGEDVKENRVALEALLGPQCGRFKTGQHWYRLEVVKLTAHVQSSFGYWPATALLLYHSVLNGYDDQFDLRWGCYSKRYLDLPSDKRSLVLKCIRFFYESDPNWEPENKTLLPWFPLS